MAETDSSDAPRPAAPILRLARQGGLYTLSGIAVKLAGLALLPLFTDPALLSQADYGRFQLLEVTAQLLILVGGLGLAQGLLRFVHAPEHSNDRRALAATTVATTAAIAIALAAAIWVVAGPLAGLLLDDAGAVRPVRLMGLYVAFKVVGAVPLTLLRADERAGSYVLATVVEAALYVAVTAYLLTARGMGVEGAIAGYAVAGAGSLATLTILTAGGARRAGAAGPLLRRDLLVPLLRFGLPLAVGALASVALNAGDRYLLKALAPGGPTAAAEAVALYGLAAKYAGLVNMLFVQSFNLAFAVVGLKALAGPDGADVHRRTFRHYAAATGWGVLGVSLLARDVTAVVSPDPAYLDADRLVLPIALGYLAYGIYFIAMNVLYAAGRSRAIAGGVGLAAGANLALNAVAIPLLGPLGAALTTLVTYAGLAGATLRRAQRAAPAPYAWGALAVVLALVVGLWLLGQPTAGWPVATRLPVRLGLIAAYPALLMAFGVYTVDEVRALAATAAGRLRRAR
jgi:O-antigen/teichoic acid export membrane protein